MAALLWRKSEFVVSGRTPLSLYTSIRSGLRVAIGDVKGPMTRSCVALVTETDSDAGLPHTLEHLIFMGSKKYPFKGFLDTIANSCFASGTNAWTDQDHTAYTLDTVGSEGFYKVFPVYLDHILYPTLTPEQYTTEVHHVTGEGTDAGVVYCEMQDYESDMDVLVDLASKKLLYPPDHPYRVQTGGTLEGLRQCCNNQKVKSFHEKFYRLGNVMATICGRVDHNRILSIFEAIEDKELSNVAPFPPTFQSPVPPIEHSRVEKIRCPSDDDSNAVVLSTWIGPPASDVVTLEALSILFQYMTDTTVSPFNRYFIDIPDPLASSVSFHVSEQTKCAINLRFAGVPTGKVDQILPLLETLITSHQKPETFDADRMKSVCEQNRLASLAAQEERPAKTIFSHMIIHHLYGGAGEENLTARLNDIECISNLANASMDFWSSLVAKFFSKPSITIIGIPDKKLVEELSAKEESRVSAQREQLGKDGLTRCHSEHCSAVHANTHIRPPKELLEKMVVDHLEQFDRFNIQVYRSTDTHAPPDVRRVLDAFPFPATLHAAPTQFAELYLLMDSGSLTVDSRRLLPLLFELIFESAAIVDGKLCSPEEVANLYTKDLLEHSFSSSIRKSFHRAVVLCLKVDAARFRNLCKWSEIFLSGVRFDADRIRMTATKMAGEAKERKRDGDTVCHTALSSIINKPDSNVYLTNEIVVEKVLEALAKECKTDPESVVKQLEELRASLLSNGLNAHVVCDPLLVSPVPHWNPRSEPTPLFKFVAGEGLSPSLEGKQIVVPVGSSESSFLYQTTPFHGGWEDERVVPLMLFCQYLSQTEGPLYEGVRGAGLAYGVGIGLNVNSSNISLYIYRSINIIQAYQKTEQIVMDTIRSGSLVSTQFEAAKRSLICDLYYNEATVGKAGSMSILHLMEGNDGELIRRLSTSIWNSSPDSVLSIAGPEVQRAFSSYGRAIACHPSKVAEVKKSFPAIQQVPLKALSINPRQ